MAAVAVDAVLEVLFGGAGAVNAFAAAVGVAGGDEGGAVGGGDLGLERTGVVDGGGDAARVGSADGEAGEVVGVGTDEGEIAADSSSLQGVAGGVEDDARGEVGLGGAEGAGGVAEEGAGEGTERGVVAVGTNHAGGVDGEHGEFGELVEGVGAGEAVGVGDGGELVGSVGVVAVEGPVDEDVGAAVVDVRFGELGAVECVADEDAAGEFVGDAGGAGGGAWPGRRFGFGDAGVGLVIYVLAGAGVGGEGDAGGGCAGPDAFVDEGGSGCRRGFGCRGAC